MQLERFLRDFQFNSCLEGILQSENYSRTDLPVGQTAEMQICHLALNLFIHSINIFPASGCLCSSIPWSATRQS